MNLKSYIIVLLSLSMCCTIYVRRTPEELAQLESNIKPLPDSMITLPDSGNSYILDYSYHANNNKYSGYYLSYRIRADRNVYCSRAIDAIEIIPIDNKISSEDLLCLFDSLNDIGFFTIKEYDIIQKMYKQKRSCMGIFLSDPRIWPPLKWTPETWPNIEYNYLNNDHIEITGIDYPYTICIRLKYFNYKIHYPQVFDQYYKQFNDMPELITIKQGIDIINKFIEEQGIAIKK